MGEVDTNLSASALSIALVALVIALGQLLQQYFATADGYRRCQKSVMGEYARMTRLRWRWREFRFETLYTTPEIFLVGDGAPSRVEQVVLAGNAQARQKSLVPSAPGSDNKSLLDDSATYGSDLELQSRQTQRVRPITFSLNKMLFGQETYFLTP
jgi:hypothetical protein